MIYRIHSSIATHILKGIVTGFLPYWWQASFVIIQLVLHSGIMQVKCVPSQNKLAVVFYLCLLTIVVKHCEGPLYDNNSHRGEGDMTLTP